MSTDDPKTLLQELAVMHAALRHVARVRQCDEATHPLCSVVRAALECDGPAIVQGEIAQLVRASRAWKASAKHWRRRALLVELAMRLEMPPAPRRHITPGPLEVLHILDGGAPLCHFMWPQVPACWPAGHKWIGLREFDDRLTADVLAKLCETCRRQASVMTGALP